MHRARQLMLVVLLFAAVPLPLVVAAAAHPTSMDWRHVRFERPAEPQLERGRTEMVFLAQYEKLRTQRPVFSQGFRQGRSLKQQRCDLIAAGRVAEADALSPTRGNGVDVIAC